MCSVSFPFGLTSLLIVKLAIIWLKGKDIDHSITPDPHEIWHWHFHARLMCMCTAYPFQWVAPHIFWHFAIAFPCVNILGSFATLRSQASFTETLLVNVL